MNERPTILQAARLDRTFRFQITKPDQILAPIMEIWDAKVDPKVIQRLCNELLEIIKQHDRQAISSQTMERITNLGKALYRQLILLGPAREDRLQTVLSGGLLPLLISTEAPEIPWELLHDGKNFVGLKYAVGRQLLKSTGVPIATPWQGDRMRCLLIADPCGDLPEARSEALTLEQWLSQQGIDCDLLLGDAATSTEIIIRLSSDDYNFIHYSGHVINDPATKIPSLVLSDQHLSASEIEPAINSANGPVVILNGCDTASVEGLANAFLKGGAQLVVGTLSNVSDYGARRWAETFYKGLISNQPAGEALRLARQATLDEPSCAAAWMAFVMYGNPCLQLVLGNKPLPEATVLDRTLQTMDLRRQDFDNNCLNILEGCLKYAGEMGNIGSAHLFTAMLEGPDSRLRDYLQAHEVEPVEMRHEFEKMFRFVEVFAQAVLVDKETGMKLSHSVSQILRDSYTHAKQAKHPQVTFDDLLFAFSQHSSGVSNLLNSMGFDLKEVVGSLGIKPSSGEMSESMGDRERKAQPPDTEPYSQVHPRDVLFRTRGTPLTDTDHSIDAPDQRLVTVEDVGPYTAQRFTEVSFPASIVKSQWYVLRVQILATKHHEQNKTVEIKMPAADDLPGSVEVCVLAPDFEAMETLQRTLAVPQVGDSKVVEFHLRAPQAGTFKICVDFIQSQCYVGSTQLEVEVLGEKRKDDINISTRKASEIGQPAIGQTGAPPDITILISEQPVPVTGQHRLKFMLHSPSSDMGLYYRDVGECVLQNTPAEWVRLVMKNVQDAIGNDQSNMVEDRLRGIGNTLWEELIPETFKNIYWELREKIHTILIVTDDPWIPWEMIRPYRRHQQDIEEDDFLCLKFSLARWLRVAPTLPKITLRETHLLGVAVDNARRFVPLPDVDHEVSAVKAVLSGMGIHTNALEPTRVKLIQALRKGGFHHLHIACHGGASSRAGDLAILHLQDGDLAPIDIAGPTMAFGRDRPFVFLNACETGRLGPSLTRLGGWAERFITAGCSGFLGTAWEVRDDLAQEFAKVFYSDICQGVPLGEACRHARSAIYKKSDPTWLAYCLYADPQAVFVMPEHLEDLYDPLVLQMLDYGIQRSHELQVDLIDSLLFFESLLVKAEGAAASALRPLNIPVKDIHQLFREINGRKSPSPPEVLAEKKVGLSKSVKEILKIAQRLARRPNEGRVQDTDVLEAFVLHGQNGVTQLFANLELEPELLLHQAFQDDGALNQRRFSEDARAILEDALRYAQRAHLIGSPQILAALAATEGSLARKKLRVRGGDLETYIRNLLDAVVIHNDQPLPNAICLETCSRRARRILNLAELIARFEAAQVGEEHLLEAYVRCAKL